MKLPGDSIKSPFSLNDTPDNAKLNLTPESLLIGNVSAYSSMTSIEGLPSICVTSQSVVFLSISSANILITCFSLITAEYNESC